jgi:hypothetical protein
MKGNQVYRFFKVFSFSQNNLLMNYKLNNQTSKSNADLSHANSWGHKLYINGLLYTYTFVSYKIKVQK